MIYNHLWSPPHVAIVAHEEGGVVHVPVQVCMRCGTTKNPLTDQLVVKRGKAHCAHQDRVEQDHASSLRRVKADLDGIEDGGGRVDRDYGRKKREPVGLPLPYKD